MKNTKLISINQFCEHHRIPKTFINALYEYQLIEIIFTKKESFLMVNQLHDIEKMIRLHYDLDINLEGIDAVYNLLKQVENMQSEIMELHNRLRFYEDY